MSTLWIILITVFLTILLYDVLRMVWAPLQEDPSWIVMIDLFVDLLAILTAKYGLMEYNLKARKEGRKRGPFQKLPRFSDEEVAWMKETPERAKDYAWAIDIHAEERKKETQ
jgi:hypothetical protein